MNPLQQQNSLVNDLNKKMLLRRDSLKNNPTPWVLLLLISCYLFYISFSPALEWLEKTKIVKELTQKNKDIAREKVELQANLDTVDAEFERKSRKGRLWEIQAFPKNIDKGKVAKIIETFMVLYNTNKQKSYQKLEINSLNIGESVVETPQSRKSPISINLVADTNSFKTFFDFLTEQDYEKLKNRAVEKNAITSFTAIDFLDNNILPIMVLESLNITEEKTKESALRAHYKIQLQGFLYSQNTQS